MMLQQRKCDLTGQPIISMYRPNAPFPVYKISEWWSDKWEGTDYGIDYNPQESFFDQFFKLKNKVPHHNLNIEYNLVTNSEYVNYCSRLKNCYLVSDADTDEDCYYCYTIANSKNLVDCSKVFRSELCYDCLDCTDCYQVLYSQDCSKCSDSFFLKNCFGCNNCFCCANLHGQNYCWHNEQLTKEEYQKKLDTVNLNSRQKIKGLKEEFRKFYLKYPQRYMHGISNVDSNGDYLYHTQRTKNSYDCRNAQNCRYCYSLLFAMADSYDVFQWGNDSQLLYEGVVVGDHDYHCKFCFQCYPSCQYLEYCFNCICSKNCFGCVGLKKREFCILNKQYSEKSFDELRIKIIENMKKSGEYGEFFPVKFSPFAYNETNAMFFYPLKKEEALEKGHTWFDQEKSQQATKDSYLCACGRQFKIIPQENEFYQKLNIPLPDKCYLCRHIERLHQRNPQKLWSRQCQKCHKEIQTTYAPDRPEIVYCEQCYNKEIY